MKIWIYGDLSDYIWLCSSNEIVHKRLVKRQGEQVRLEYYPIMSEYCEFRCDFINSEALRLISSINSGAYICNIVAGPW